MSERRIIAGRCQPDPQEIANIQRDVVAGSDEGRDSGSIHTGGRRFKQ